MNNNILSSNLYIEKAADRLTREGYVSTKEIRCKGYSFDLVARRKKFEFEVDPVVRTG